MTHKSLQKDPTKMIHSCGGEWDQYSVEFPARIVVCTRCLRVLEIAVYDPETGATLYRQANES